MIKLEIFQESELHKVLEIIQKDFFDYRIFLLEGDLGSGKTTLVKYFVHSIDPNFEIQSPTFSVVNIYQVKKYSILHADLYRLKSEEEVLETGITELLLTSDYCFIEWFDLILPWINKALKIQINTETDGNRIFSFSIYNN